MKSSKTKVLSFDKWINDNGFNFRPEQYDLYKFLYEAGQQSEQDEIDHLQKRIESAMELLEYNEYVDSALQALEILKGEETK